MDFNVHDSTGQWIGIIENPVSAIWARRYNTPNDFELYIPATPEILAMLSDDCYITREDAPEVMIVEHIELVTSEESGDYILVSGRGAESLLDRRIVWNQTAVKGCIGDAIFQLIEENAISPAIPSRALPITMHRPELAGIPVTWEMGTISTTDGAENDSTTRFREVEYIPIGHGVNISLDDTQRVHLYYYDAEKNYLGATGWHSVTSYTITPSTYEGAVYLRAIISRRDNAAITDLAAEASTVHVQHGVSAQHTGTGLLEAVKEKCAAYGLGFRAVADDYLLVVPRIEIFEGLNRCEGQERNSPVIFSSEFENIRSSSYVLDTSNLKNVVLVAGEGEGKNRKRATIGTASGLIRREMYVDARDLSTNEGEITESEYSAQLIARGVNAMAEHGIMEAFEGEIDTSNTFILDKDYTLGDIVTVENEYGIRKNVRIAAIVETWDEVGYTASPTYENVEV